MKGHVKLFFNKKRLRLFQTVDIIDAVRANVSSNTDYTHPHPRDNCRHAIMRVSHTPKGNQLALAKMW